MTNDIAQSRLPGRLALVLVVFILGCTAPVVRFESLGTDESACLAWYRKLDHLLTEHDLVDPSAARIAGFPFLRADRFLASFRTQTLTDAAYADWLERMQQLDASLRLSEAANLPPAATKSVLAVAPAPGSLEQVLKQCGSRLVNAARQRPEYKPFLRRHIQVPDAYRSWQRFAGAYWLTQFPAKLALKNLHKKLAANFRLALADVPIRGRLIRYKPSEISDSTSRDITAMLRAAYRNPLGIPTLSGEELRRLFVHYAPIWEIDTRNDTDKIGAVSLRNHGEPSVDTDRKSVV